MNMSRLRRGLAVLAPSPWLASLAAAVLLGLCASTARAELPPLTEPGSFDLIEVSPAPDKPRRLRADFEPIDVLALVHIPEWEDSVQRIIELVIDEVEVHVLAIDEGPESRRFHRWARRSGARVTYLDHDSPWIRDYGPLQVFEGAGAPIWIDFGYSDDRRLDDAVPGVLARKHRAALDPQHLVSFDGGGIVSDGDGLCVVTDYTLDDTGLAGDDPARQRLLARMGCRVTAVVPKLDNEETGHIDLAVQFLAPDRVAVAQMDPWAFPQQAAALDGTAEMILRAARRLHRPMRVVRVPMLANGEIFYSYLNGTRVGDMFLVPAYSNVPPAEEAAAHGTLAANMPGVRLLTIPADAMVELGGAVHCITVGLNVSPRLHARLPRKRPVRRAVPRPTRRRRG